MRIAVTHEDGNVFGHFGHSEQFKIYDVEDDEILSEEIIGSDGNGHEALADLLNANAIDVVICGGIGRGAVEALVSHGIEVCSGVTGNADKAVKAYLAGELESEGINCSHHDAEGAEGEESCGSCNGGCSGCHGGCHSEPPFEGKNVGKTCRTHYKGTFNDGTQFDSSYDRGEPLEFVCGAGMMIRGFDEAVANMEVGETVNIHLMPSEAYGEYDPTAVFTVDIEQMPGSEELEKGQQIYLQDPYGRPFPAKVAEKDEKTITFDLNHEMAGKELNFKIELVEVK